MIKYFCDRCGKETDKGLQCDAGLFKGHGYFVMQYGNPRHLCEECTEKFNAIKNSLEHYEEIFDMSDEDIELLLYTFKVGDKVITDDGRAGTITSICDCERCKKRGFYEPVVDMDFGVGQIWITDTDKGNGFANFYQIGNHVFGNVDVEASERIRKRIRELKNEIIEYEAQLNMMNKLEDNNENN